MAFLYYRKSDKKLMGNSGYPVYPIYDGEHFRDFTGEDGIRLNVIPNFGGTLDDYGYLQLTDQEMAWCYASASYEIQFDAQNNPIGVITYDWLQVSASPNPATISEAVTVMATLPAGTPDTEVIFQLEDGTVYTEPVTNGQASHAYAFVLSGIYCINVSSAHHGVVTVEVLVQ